jgi:hypothetical protein
MTQTEKLLTLLVILAMAAVSTVSLGAAEKQAGGAGDKRQDRGRGLRAPSSPG